MTQWRHNYKTKNCQKSFFCSYDVTTWVLDFMTNPITYQSTQFLILHRLVPTTWPWRHYFDYFRFQPTRTSGLKSRFLGFGRWGICLVGWFFLKKYKSRDNFTLLPIKKKDLSLIPIALNEIASLQLNVVMSRPCPLKKAQCVDDAQTSCLSRQTSFFWQTVTSQLESRFG